MDAGLDESVVFSFYVDIVCYPEPAFLLIADWLKATIRVNFPDVGCTVKLIPPNIGYKKDLYLKGRKWLKKAVLDPVETPEDIAMRIYETKPKGALDAFANDVIASFTAESCLRNVANVTGAAPKPLGSYKLPPPLPPLAVMLESDHDSVLAICAAHSAWAEQFVTTIRRQ